MFKLVTIAKRHGVRHSPVMTDKTPRTDRGRKTLRQRARGGGEGIWRARLSRSGDHRHHPARRGRARHLLHLFRKQGGAVPRARPRHEPRRPPACRRGGRATRPTGSPPNGSASPPSSPSSASIASSTGSSRKRSSSRQDVYREHYLTFVDGYRRNLASASARGEIKAGDDEPRAWALIGMSVFLGMRYGIWDEDLRPPRSPTSRSTSSPRGCGSAKHDRRPARLIARRAALTPDRIALEEVATGRAIDLCRTRPARRPRRRLARRAQGSARATASRSSATTGSTSSTCCSAAPSSARSSCRSTGGCRPPSSTDCSPTARRPCSVYGEEETEAAHALAGRPRGLCLDADYEARLAAAPDHQGRPQWPSAGDLVPALHVGDDRAAQGRDLHLPHGARELRQYRRGDRPELDRHDRQFPASVPHRRDQPLQPADPDRGRAGDRRQRLRRRRAGRPARAASARHLLRRARPSIRPCSIIRASPRRRSIMSATGAAAARPCPTAWSSATARSACASATAWA